MFLLAAGETVYGQVILETEVHELRGMYEIGFDSETNYFCS